MAVSQKPGILFTAFLAPPQKENAVAYRQNPNFSVIASQEDSDETASDFACRVVGELVPREFVRTLCSQAPGAGAAGAVIADFGHGKFTVFAFKDGPFPAVRDLPKLNVVLSIASQAVDDPSTLPIVASGQVMFHLFRSLGSSNAAVYVRTTNRLIWTLDVNMPTSISDLPQVVRVCSTERHIVAPTKGARRNDIVPVKTSIAAAEPATKKAQSKRKQVPSPKISSEAILLGKKTKFTKEESACLEQAFLESFKLDKVARIPSLLMGSETHATKDAVRDLKPSTKKSSKDNPVKGTTARVAESPLKTPKLVALKETNEPKTPNGPGKPLTKTEMMALQIVEETIATEKESDASSVEKKVEAQSTDKVEKARDDEAKSGEEVAKTIERENSSSPTEEVAKKKKKKKKKKKSKSAGEEIPTKSHRDE